MMKFKAAIALGSNIGNSNQILKNTIQLLAQSSEVKLMASSSWYETVAIGPPQPNYVNGCAVLETDLSPQALLDYLLSIEQQFGRVRAERWGPRTLDLDIILYAQLQLTTETLTIPHPHFQERAFVLIPLAAIAPNWIDPNSGKTILELSQAVDSTDILKCL
ncbi:MAG: 2-amino-4-hydroxy-6-hydroxymethyldihydropteridine diphosphokinase [Microcystaceae cyanobacterium]